MSDEEFSHKFRENYVRLTFYYESLFSEEYTSQPSISIATLFGSIGESLNVIDLGCVCNRARDDTTRA